MEEWKKRRIKICLRNIKDKFEAIKKEIELDKPHKHYILEKIESIVFESTIIENICESEEKQNE